MTIEIRYTRKVPRGGGSYTRAHRNRSEGAGPGAAAGWHGTGACELQAPPLRLRFRPSCLERDCSGRSCPGPATKPCPAGHPTQPLAPTNTHASLYPTASTPVRPSCSHVGVFKTASGLVDKAADLVPDSVPRSTAKAGVTVAGVMFTFWVLNKVRPRAVRRGYMHDCLRSEDVARNRGAAWGSGGTGAGQEKQGKRSGGTGAGTGGRRRPRG